MYTIITKTKEFKAYNYIKDDSHDALFIRTDKFTPIEAYLFFGQKEEIEIIKITNDNDPAFELICKWYTKIHGVYESPLLDNDKVIQIWLKREFPE